MFKIHPLFDEILAYQRLICEPSVKAWERWAQAGKPVVEEAEKDPQWWADAALKHDKKIWNEAIDCCLKEFRTVQPDDCWFSDQLVRLKK